MTENGWTGCEYLVPPYQDIISKLNQEVIAETTF